jgi:putative phosphoribosyl transferase
LGTAADVTLGLPRGGVVVAAEVARHLGCPLATLVVRKIGHPHHREMAVGALAEPDVVVFDRESLRWSPPDHAELEAVEWEELQRLRQYQKLFHPDGLPELAGKKVLLVDDGLATGATMDAAVRAARKRDAKQIIVAVPVASVAAARRLTPLADEVISLVVDEDFMAVGQYYETFAQISDAEVVALLKLAAV